MPYTIAHPTSTHTEITYFDTTGSSEVYEAVVVLQSSELFPNQRSSLHDFANVTNFEFDPEPTEALAAINIGAAVSYPRRRIAVVGTHPNLLLMVAKFIAINIRTYPIQVFVTKSEAISWLRQHDTTNWN